MGWFKRGPSEEIPQGSVAHAHSSSGFIHFHLPGITAPITDSWIIIDLSDTANWGHSATYRSHIDVLQFQVDPGVNSAWTANLWVVENVTATNSLRTMVWSKSGEKSTGNRAEVFERYTPYGPVLDSSKIVSTMKETSVDYNSATNLKTVISPGSATTPPGNGDLILEIDLDGDDINLHLLMAYHTHDKFHG